MTAEDKRETDAPSTGNDVVPLDHNRRQQGVKEQLILEAFHESPLPFGVYDDEDRLVAWNPAYEALHPEAFASHPEEIAAGTLTYKSLIRYQLDKMYPPAQLDAVASAGTKRHDFDGSYSDIVRYESSGHHKVYRYALPSGGVAGLAMDINDLIDTQNELARSRRNAENAAAHLEAANVVIEKLANSDHLTGLGNRRVLVDALEQAREDASLVDELLVCLQFDLDGFKQINDNLGHAAGDHVLREFATFLLDLARPDDLAVRLGGDEFALVMFGSADEALGREVAQRAIDRLRHPILFNGSPCRVGVSVGISTCKMSELDVDGVLIGADLAMYQAKQAGPSNIRVFDRSVRRAVRSQTQLHEMISEALEREEFVPHYQPQFSTDDMSISGVEALIRWTDAAGRLREAGQFLDVAQGHSLVGALDRQMFKRVAEDMDMLEERGHLPAKVSLNVGYERLLDPKLVTDLSSMRRPGLRVAIELLETLPLEDLDEQLDTVTRGLHDNNIEIEIDRFGTNRASLATLVAISPTAMKIGHNIVHRAPEVAEMRTLIRAIVEIGNRFGIVVIAQGVATKEQFGLVRRLGCGHAQGLWLAEPMPRDQLFELLAERAMIANANKPSKHPSDPVSPTEGSR